MLQNDIKGFGKIDLSGFIGVGVLHQDNRTLTAGCLIAIVYRRDRSRKFKMDCWFFKNIKMDGLKVGVRESKLFSGKSNDENSGYMSYKTFVRDFIPNFLLDF